MCTTKIKRLPAALPQTSLGGPQSWRKRALSQGISEVLWCGKHVSFQVPTTKKGRRN